MSVLAFPRIHFRGRCLINPLTANNDDVMEAIDEAHVGIEPNGVNTVHLFTKWFALGIRRWASGR